MAYKAEIFTSTIIAVGDFNPAIFSPDWLERNKLVGEDDAAEAREASQDRPLLVTRQATSFETGWFALQVLENQLTLTSKGVLSPVLKDLAVGIFQLVSHTPIKAVGLNFIAHYKLPSESDYHKVGDVFAPKTIWDTLYPDMATGLEQITIRFQSGTRGEPSTSKDEKRITLQHSPRLKNGVSLSFNDHHDVTEGDDSQTAAERVAGVIDEQWELVLDDAHRVFDQILTKAIES